MIIISIWSTKKWKTTRDEFIKGKECAWCGSDKFLSPHHKYNSKYIRRSIEREIVRKLIKQKMDSSEIEQQFKKQLKYLCPECGYEIKIHKYGRGIQKTGECPKCMEKVEERITDHGFRYKICKSFDIVKDKIISVEELEYFLGKPKFKEFVKNYKDEIDRLTDEAGAPPPYDYYDLKRNAIVLCKRCHYAAGHGRDLCPKCKKGYKGKQYEVCFKCLPEERKKEIEEKQKFYGGIIPEFLENQTIN